MESKTHSHSADAQSLDTRFALMSDRRRLYVVESLSGRESPVTLDELAAAVAAQEHDAEADDVSGKTTDRVGATLHHVHLPKLAANDVIDYDAEAKAVTSVQLEALTPFLGLSEDGR